MKRIKLSVAIAILATLLVTSFSTDAFAMRPGKPGGDLKFVVMSDPIYLCPPMATDSASSDVYQFLFEGLLKVDKNYNKTY
jgi:ABC-type oligopeptide transport system substrate-binding subunit